MSRPVILDADDSTLDSLSPDAALRAVRDLVSYVRQLEGSQCAAASSTGDTATSTGPIQTITAGGISISEERLRQQQQEASRRENVLVMRLTAKEQEVQEYLSKLEEMRMNSASTSRTVLLDPVVNIMFQRMKSELKQAREQVDQARQELNAWKFTPDSNTGKRLMARCRTLIQENEELGKLCNSGRVAKLEGDLAMTRTNLEDIRRTQAEVDDFLLELDEDMEGLQSTIFFLQGQLKKLHEENRRLRALAGLGPEESLDNAVTKKQPSAPGSMKMEECPANITRSCSV